MLLAPEKLQPGVSDKAVHPAGSAPGWTVIAHACHRKHVKCKCPEPRWQHPCAHGCACARYAGPPPPPFVSVACGGYAEEITIGDEVVFQDVLIVHTKCIFTRAECACTCHHHEPQGQLELI